MFDVPLAQKAAVSFRAELPSQDEPWQIGMIVGPSGSGKTTIARHA
jgi:ABC-type Fe3+/spermidine/putrescine transport system ATPase subunit